MCILFQIAENSFFVSAHTKYKETKETKPCQPESQLLFFLSDVFPSCFYQNIEISNKWQTHETLLTYFMPNQNFHATVMGNTTPDSR